MSDRIVTPIPSATMERTASTEEVTKMGSGRRPPNDVALEAALGASLAKTCRP